MLKSAEQNIRKPNDMLMVQKGKNFKKKGKGKAKGKDKAQVENSIKPKSNGKSKPSPSAGSQWKHCNEIGHWKRNCTKYLEDMKKKKGSETSASGIYVIEIHITTPNLDSWVLDTGSGALIWEYMQGRSKMLAKGEVELRVGNGARVAALAVGDFPLYLPSGFVLELSNCYYVPVISRNIISISGHEWIWV